MVRRLALGGVLAVMVFRALLAAPAVNGTKTERTAVLDALRVPVRKELKKPVLFKVDHLKMQDGWAFMTGEPQQPGGKAMDYRGTRYQKATDDGVFDDWICALLRRKKGKWTVLRYRIGATDVAWIGWDAEFKAPKGIFPKH
jgi:hypothetical protein